MRSITKRECQSCQLADRCNKFGWFDAIFVKPIEISSQTEKRAKSLCQCLSHNNSKKL